VYQSMKAKYGVHSCHLLKINTVVPSADDPDSPGCSLPDPWSAYAHKITTVWVLPVILSYNTTDSLTSLGQSATLLPCDLPLLGFSFEIDVTVTTSNMRLLLNRVVIMCLSVTSVAKPVGLQNLGTTIMACSQSTNQENTNLHMGRGSIVSLPRREIELHLPALSLCRMVHRAPTHSPLLLKNQPRCPRLMGLSVSIAQPI